jgi:hypothetical protein
MDEFKCQHCGKSPTKLVTFQQNIGMLVARRHVSVTKFLCRRCIGGYYRSFTLTTLFLGWWGFISFIMTPVILISNTYNYLKSLRLPSPGLPVDSQFEAPVAKIGQGNIWFKLIYGAIVCAVVGGAIASGYVDFFEKHAPKVNALLHSGDITSDSDADYGGTKISEDLDALTADLKGKTYPEMRAEILARQSFLDDLNAQNDKFQRHADQERLGKMDTSDVCEQIALNDWLPALDNYAKAQTAVMRAVKGSPDPSVLTDDLVKQVDTATDRYNTSTKSFHEKGCGK